MEQANTDNVSVIGISNFNLDEAKKVKEMELFEDITPMYNIRDDDEFKINLNIDSNLLDTDSKIILESMPQSLFEVYLDRECTKSTPVTVKYDKENNSISVKSGRAYGRYSTVEYDEICPEDVTWGGLQTYYLVIRMDISAKTLVKLEKPKRMMFTIATNIDAPSITVKPNKDGNLTLYWDEIPGATEYKIYAGSDTGMSELKRTKNTEFVLTDDNSKEKKMNYYVYADTEYAVMAVNNSDESKLSNIINSNDFTGILPYHILDYEGTFFESEGTKFIDLPTNIEVEMIDNSKKKVYPVLWDFTSRIKDGDGLEYYKGKVCGTTLCTYYYTQKSPSQEEIAEVTKNIPETNAIAIEPDDIINIPNSPSRDDVITDNTVIKPEASTQQLDSDSTLEIAMAKGMLKHQERINLSAYENAGDPIYLKDVLQKVITQYPLILDEEDFSFDFKNKELLVKYRYTKEEAAKKQKEVQEKVKSVVAEVITSNMTIEEKEKALHDWIMSNGRYHDEVLNAYENGEDLNEISNKYSDSFSVYGILISGLGVCQSYAETYKALCDEASVPCVVINGSLGTVPHAWNKVKLDNSWYNVDVTNNDGDDAIPYAVFNASDKLTANEYTEDDTYTMDSEIENYISNDDSKDYYKLNNSFAESEEDLRELLKENIIKQNNFYIKVVPNIENDKTYDILKEEFDNYTTENMKIGYGMIFSVLGVKFE